MRVQRPTLGPKYELFSYIYFIIVPSISPNIFFWLNLTINCTLVGELLYLKLIIPFLQSCSFLLAHTTVFSAHSNSNKTQTSKVGPKANLAKINFINTSIIQRPKWIAVTWKCNYFESATVPCRIQMSVHLMLQKGVGSLTCICIRYATDKIAFRKNLWFLPPVHSK